MAQQDTLDALNARTPEFIRLMGGQVVGFDADEKSCTFEFDIGKQFCHSVDVVQGGFITAMLDAAMSHAVFSTLEDIGGVSSLEIKTSYLETTRAGRVTAVGKIIKSSYKTAFLESHMYNAEGLLTATASSVAKIVRKS